MFHKVILVGNLGRDPELRYTPNGNPVCNMNVATNRQWTNSDGETVEEVVWFRVTTWGRQAEVNAQYLSKGRQVLVEGRLIADENGNPKTFERSDGSPGASFEINAQMVRFLGARPDGDGQGDEVMVEDLDEEEIPF